MSEQEQLLDAPERDGMPVLGLGTWQNEDPTQCAESVRTALETGYRHIDTAQIYENEAAVGEGIAAADVDREDVFLATKVWIDSLAPEDVLAVDVGGGDAIADRRLVLVYLCGVDVAVAGLQGRPHGLRTLGGVLVLPRAESEYRHAVAFGRVQQLLLA